MSPARDAEGRERNARWLGVAVGAAAMTAAWFAIGWPAPAVSVALGMLAYGLVRESGRGTGDRA